MNNPWEILEIEPTDNLSIIKSAYAKLIKIYRPNEHPEEFQEIRQAYENVTAIIASGQDIHHNAKQAKNLTDKERLFKALDNLMDIYEDLESRNDVKAWTKGLSNPDLILYSEDLLETGHSFLREILKYEFLYQTELKLNIEIYVMLFDFFQLDETSYLLDNYNHALIMPLSDQIKKHKFVIKELNIPASKFNENTPKYQINAEAILEDGIINYSGTELLEYSTALINIVNNRSSKERVVIKRVIFKYILDSYLRADINQDKLVVGLMYQLFKFNAEKSSFIKIFTQLNYHKQDIINCLKFCQEAYDTSIEITKPNKYSQIFMAILLVLYLWEVSFLCL
jgi:hypothetical protein